MKVLPLVENEYNLELLLLFKESNQKSIQRFYFSSFKNRHSLMHSFLFIRIFN